MKDRIITLLCLLGMLLTFGVLVSWARSMMNCEGVTVSHHYCHYTLETNQGLFIFSREERLFDTPRAEEEWRDVMGGERPRYADSWYFNWPRNMIAIAPPDNSFLGFGAESSVFEPQQWRFFFPGVTSQQTLVQVPHWFVIVLLGGFPTWWLMRRSRRHRDRTKQGLCRRCGFEMGTLYHLCPKCGERAPLPENFSVIQTN